jgi:ketosteroid isomerase-like protein
VRGKPQPWDRADEDQVGSLIEIGEVRKAENASPEMRERARKAEARLQLAGVHDPRPCGACASLLYAISARDLDEAQAFFTHDAVLDMTRTTGVVVHGLDAIRAWQEDWLAGYEEAFFTAEEIIDAGNGVAFVRELQTARPTGTIGHVTQRQAEIWITDDGCFVRVIVYPNSELDEARAAAERLAGERG